MHKILLLSLLIGSTSLIASCGSGDGEQDNIVENSVESAADRSIGAAEIEGSSLDAAFKSAEQNSDEIATRQKSDPADAENGQAQTAAPNAQNTSVETVEDENAANSQSEQ